MLEVSTNAHEIQAPEFDPLSLFLGFQAVDLPADVLRDDRFVTVRATDRGLEFRSRENQRPAGMIFLPGGMVQPTAYAPLMRRIASAGYSAYLLYLPMRCACTDAQVRELFPNISRVMEAGMIKPRFREVSSKDCSSMPC